MSENRKSSGLTVRKALAQAKDILDKAGIENAYIDARLLLMHVTGYNLTGIMMHMEDDLTDAEADRYLGYVERRSERYPLQYITGVQDFMGYEFTVSPDVLIPRQDTEVLVERALAEAEGMSCEREDGREETGAGKKLPCGLRVLDMCTGSGCIGISYRKKRLEAGYEDEVTLSDISEKALIIAGKNNERHKAGCSIVQSDMFQNIPDTEFDMILSNPPYIETEVIEGLMQEVKDYEPYMALCGDTDGLKYYRIIAKEAGRHLCHGGRLLLEIGYNQYAEVRSLLADNGFININIYQDYAGSDRVVSAEYAKPDTADMQKLTE